jgi:glutathione synthase/RimK-type ligase-like ATP-grasp enzyme
VILALTSSGDLTTDYVIRSLERFGHDTVRLNTNDLLSEWQFEIAPTGMRFWSDDRTVDPNKVEAVYYRRAFLPRPPPVASRESWDFIVRESRVLQYALYDALQCRWISHHAAIRAAENKPRQLRSAARLGFAVPETVITNDGAVAKRFALKHNKIVTKPLSYGDLGRGQVVHTNVLEGWSDDYINEVEVAPTLLQRYIEKRADLRVTVVDNQVFACRIYSQDNPAYSVDMRRGLSDDMMRHELVELALPLVDLCLNLVKEMGLRFAPLDFAEDLDGMAWFLEINPNGQWAWIQDRTGAPISDAIAKALSSGA